ncbi:MAG: hypothetical protein ACO3N7_10720, partial [Kiritimatiellia bacterium]
MKKTAVKKSASSKPERMKPASAKKSPGRSLNGREPTPVLAKAVKGKPLTKRELKKYEKILLELRERL